MSDDFINAPSTFNEEGQLWNSNALQRRPTILQELRESIPTARTPENTGRILRKLGVTQEELQGARTVSQTTAVDHRELGGTFSLLRAARVAHQHRIGFWGRNRVTGYLGATGAPDPTEEDLQSQYEDMLLFSYMPVELEPTFSAFRDISSPQRRVEYLLQAQLKTGVTVAGDVSPRAAGASRSSRPSLPPSLPFPPPFAEQLQSRCSDLQRYFRHSGPLTYTAEQYRNEE